MTNTKAVRVVCEAAALTDTEAIAFLCGHLESLVGHSEGKGVLIVALAWLDIEQAWVWAHTLPERHGLTQRQDSFVWRELEKLQEVHALCAGGRDQLEAYHTITALLPQQEYETLLRKQIYYWSVALTSPVEFLALPEWFLVMTSPFLVAWLWHDYTEQFWEILRNNQGLQARFASIEQIVLANRASERDVAILVEFLKIRSAAPRYIGLSASSLFQVIEVLEARAPQEMAALAPGILRTIGRWWGDKDSILTARMLVVLARLKLDDPALVTPLIERIKGQENHRVARRWARHTAYMVRRIEPVPSMAQVHARLLRVLALEQTLKSALTRKLSHHTQARVRRAWRWLQKSDRVIETIADAEWRKHLYNSKAHLEQKVRRSRKLVHIRARIEGWQ